MAKIQVADVEILVKALKYFAKNHPRQRVRAEKELKKWEEAPS